MKRLKIKKLNNDGAALIMAIVVVTFMTILTTLLLYLSVMNYEMKTTDYRTKVSFYGAEMALEELRMQMAVDVSDAAKFAYEQVMLYYGYMDADLREAEFENLFFSTIAMKWNNRISTLGGWRGAMASMLSPELQAKSKIVFSNDTTEDPTKPYRITLLETPEDYNGDSYQNDLDRLVIQEIVDPVTSETTKRMVLQNIRVRYTENGFTSEILTDMCIVVPEIDWTINNYLSPDVMPAGAADRTRIIFEGCVTYLDWTKQ